MKRKYLILEELDNALKYWEDCNLFGKVIFKIQTAFASHPLGSKLLNITGTKNDFKAFIGSELSYRGFLVRDIKNYTNLRLSLHNRMDIGPMSFLPRVPAEIRECIDQLQMSRSSIRSRPINIFPYMIARWSEYRKVFSIEDANLIPGVPLNVNNCLHMMPFEAFMIRFENNLAFSLPESKIEKIFSCCICASHENILDILFLPAITEENLMGKEVKSFFEKMASGPKLDLKYFEKQHHLLTRFDPGAQEPSILKVSVNMTTGHYIFDVNPGLTKDDVNSLLQCNPYSDTFDIYTSDGEVIDSFKGTNPEYGNDFLTMMKIVTEMVNGFCYSVSQLRSGKHPESAGVKPANQEFPEFNDFGWNAVPITQTQFLKPSEESGIPRLVFSTGREKSPHPRKGHPRTTILKDGSSHTQWIEPTFVRADKLETEDFQGSVTKIKESRESD